MEFAWSEQQRELLDAVSRFAREQLNYDVIENDRNGVFNHEAWKKCGEFGIQGLLTPTEYGGLGQDPLDLRRRFGATGLRLQRQRPPLLHQCPHVDCGYSGGL